MARVGSDCWSHIWSNNGILILAWKTYACPVGSAWSLNLVVSLRLQFDIEGTEQHTSSTHLLRNAQSQVLHRTLLVKLVTSQRHLYCCSLWLLRPVFTPTPDSIGNTSLSTRLALDRFQCHKHRRGHCSTHQIQRAPNQMIPHTGTILTPTPSHHHHTVLLHVMTLPRNIRADHLARRQSDFRRLALSRIRLFGLGDADFEADAFDAGPLLVRHGGRDGAAARLRLPRTTADLVEGGEEGWCGSIAALLVSEEGLSWNKRNMAMVTAGWRR